MRIAGTTYERSASINSAHCSFSGKEKDAETGYGYFGARYMDHELMTMWLSVDPMADKYPNISPYAYCAWNPVKLVDTNGKEWDLSALTEAQQKKFNESIDALCKNSPLFNEIYCRLTESKVVYRPLIGKTQDDAPAQYNPSNQTITFLDNAGLASANAFAEELIHAYQLTENTDKYDHSLDFNYEFEAKIIKTLIQYESGGCSPINGMVNIQNIIETKYDFGSELNYQEVTTPAFMSIYMNYANSYATYNKTNNIGNEHYKNPTSQSPASLNLLLKTVRP